MSGPGITEGARILRQLMEPYGDTPGAHPLAQRLDQLLSLHTTPVAVSLLFSELQHLGWTLEQEQCTCTSSAARAR